MLPPSFRCRGCDPQDDPGHHHCAIRARAGSTRTEVRNLWKEAQPPNTNPGRHSLRVDIMRNHKYLHLKNRPRIRIFHWQRIRLAKLHCEVRRGFLFQPLSSSEHKHGEQKIFPQLLLISHRWNGTFDLVINMVRPESLTPEEAEAERIRRETEEAQRETEAAEKKAAEEEHHRRRREWVDPQHEVPLPGEWPAPRNTVPAWAPLLQHGEEDPIAPVPGGIPGAHIATRTYTRIVDIPGFTRAWMAWDTRYKRQMVCTSLIISSRIAVSLFSSTK